MSAVIARRRRAGRSTARRDLSGHRPRHPTATSSSPCSVAAARARARCCGRSPASTRSRRVGTRSRAAVGRVPGRRGCCRGPGARQRASSACRERRTQRRAGEPRWPRSASRPRGRLAQDALRRRGPARRAGPGARPRARAAAARRAVRCARRADPHPHARPAAAALRPPPTRRCCSSPTTSTRRSLLADRVLVLDGGRFRSTSGSTSTVPATAPTRRSPRSARACSPSSASTPTPSIEPEPTTDPHTRPTTTEGAIRPMTRHPSRYRLPPPRSRSTSDRCPAPSVPRSAASTSAAARRRRRRRDPAAWLECKVVFFPGQHLDADEHRRSRARSAS